LQSNCKTFDITKFKKLKKKTLIKAGTKLQQLHPPKCGKIEIMVIEKRTLIKKTGLQGLKTT
jgi:hypothetical protein